tara:strand:+ start:1935 stop:3020 length:1086 start_codon:yes stop_codon:yes gene_type:complete
MLFANKKEEVLDVQLTPHGRYLLSIGKLKPVYYSFHDSNILYDGKYVGLSEYTKEIEDRIQHNTPQAKTQISRASRDQNVKQIDSTVLSAAAVKSETARLASVTQMNEDKMFLSTHPLGTCSPTTQLAPNWSIKVLNGEIISSIPQLTASYQTLQIPQIDIDIKYKTGIFSTGSNSSLIMDPDPAIASRVFSDGTYVGIDPDHLLLEVVEENTEYNKTNFEIEVYEIEEEDKVSARAGLTGARSIIENMKPLYFEKPDILIENNILLDEPVTTDTNLLVADRHMANYYFNVFVDNEIDLTDICVAKDTFESKNLFVDLDIDCTNIVGGAPTKYNVYLDGAAASCPTPTDTTSTTSTSECDD